MRTTNELARMYTSLYGFFNHVVNQQYKFAWKAADLLQGQKPFDIQGNAIPHMLGKFMTYFVVPAVIEELVTPYTNEEKDSWGMKAGKSLALGLSASLPFVRDLVRSLISGKPSGGLLDSVYQPSVNVINALGQRGPLNKDQQGKLIADTTALIGNATGLTNAHEGRVAEYIYRYSQGLEKPKGFGDVLTGLWHGKTNPSGRSTRGR